MDENLNTITYDENWQNVSEPEYHVIDDREDDDLSYEEREIDSYKAKKDYPKQILVTVQLILCLLIALSAFAIKTIGGDLYENCREMYYAELNNSAIFDGRNSFDLQSLFGKTTQDEI